MRQLHVEQRQASLGGAPATPGMPPTDIRDPDYFHKVVDCQWACPAHTPVPEYIRLIAAGRYSDAYMVNWHSNVFPGILGRTCDRPCEPACPPLSRWLCQPGLRRQVQAWCRWTCRGLPPPDQAEPRD